MQSQKVAFYGGRRTWSNSDGNMAKLVKLFAFKHILKPTPKPQVIMTPNL